MIVGHEPPVGDVVGEESVVLFVSASADVPDLVGGTEDEAREALGALGARVVVDRIFDPAAAEGTVLSALPPPGEPLPGEVTLTVAAPPSSVFLGALDPVSGGCASDAVTVNGTAFADSLVCTARTDPSTTEYALNRRVTLLDGVIGLDDRGATGPAVIFRFVGDDRVLAEETVAFGDARELQVSVVGVLRLRIEVLVADPDDDCCSSAPDAVLGDVRLIAGPDQIDALVAESAG